MHTYKDLKNVIKNKLCTSCGSCAYHAKEKLEFNYNFTTEMFQPNINNNFSKDLYCPSVEIDMPKHSVFKHGKKEPQNAVGIYSNTYAGYSKNSFRRHNSGSSGMINEIIKYILENKIVDKVFTCAHEDSPLKSKGRVLSNINKLNEIQSSIYHSVNFENSAYELVKNKKKFAFVGLPCQVMALQELKMKDPNIKKLNIITLGLFCGGYIKPSGTKYYLKNFLNQNTIKKIKDFRYRIKPFPGKLKTIFNDGTEMLFPRLGNNNKRLNILRFMISDSFYTYLKCKLCPDQLNDFSDISFGDPHFTKYMHDPRGYSLIVARSIVGEKLLLDISKNNLLFIKKINYKLILKSQAAINLRRNIHINLRVARFLGLPTLKIKNYSTFKDQSFSLYAKSFFNLIKIKIGTGKLKMLFIAYPLQIVEYLFFTRGFKLIFIRIYEMLFNKKVKHSSNSYFK